jgi:hypothetical protein
MPTQIPRAISTTEVPKTSSHAGGPMAAVAELERRVMAAVKASAERGDPPLLQAAEAARCIREAPAFTPGGLALSQALVANLCFAHNTAAMWKLLDQAMLSRLVDPLHTLALLTPRCLSDSTFPSPLRVVSLINWVSALFCFQMLSCLYCCYAGWCRTGGSSRRRTCSTSSFSVGTRWLLFTRSAWRIRICKDLTRLLHTGVLHFWFGVLYS